MNRCKHKKAKRIDARFQVFWCPTCGAIKTPSAVTSGRYQWMSPQFARDHFKKKEEPCLEQQPSA